MFAQRALQEGGEVGGRRVHLCRQDLLLVRWRRGLPIQVANKLYCGEQGLPQQVC